MYTTTVRRLFLKIVSNIFIIYIQSKKQHLHIGKPQGQHRAHKKLNQLIYKQKEITICIGCNDIYLKLARKQVE